MQCRIIRRPALWAALTIISLCFIPVSGAADAGDQRVVTVHAVGGSLIQGADTSASREAAIADGLVAAITRVLLDLVPDKVAVGHFQVLSDSILANPDPYILNYEMLTESIGAKQYRVMVKVNVSVEMLKRGLKKAGIHLGRRPYPQVLYCIAEKAAGAAEFQYWWGGHGVWVSGPAADALQKGLAAKGFGQVRPEAVADGGLPLELGVAGAVQLGRKTGADVVIVAQAVAEAAPNTMGATLQSFRGTISARAYAVSSGQEMGQAFQYALASADNPDAGSAEALGKAAASAAEDLATEVARAWFDAADTASAVEIRVAGISGNVASFVKFRGALSSMSGVDSVQRKEMQHDQAVLLVNYQGNARALADALLRQSFETFGLNISEPQGNMIEVQLIPR